MYLEVISVKYIKELLGNIFKIKMTNKTLKQVEDFHDTFGVPVLETPTIPNEDRCKLRIDLIQEELDELKTAIADKNIVEIADALCDLQYVLNGTILEFGMKEAFEELFDDVHDSNMSKSCGTERHAKETVDLYTEKGVETYYQKADYNINGFVKYNVYRKSDDKVLKNRYYRPADLKSILDKY